MQRAGVRGAWMLVAALLAATPAPACINTFATEFMRHKRSGDAEQMKRSLAEAEQAYQKSQSLENANDLAVGWILTGRGEQGIQLLRDQERRTPGSAIVAANLGTALELAGADAEALEWIGESVRRDPKEHQGSEWVHVKILEAKLALKRDPQWLHSHSVLGWRAGDPPLRDERGKVRADRDVADAIQYQLHERTVFVHAPDAVVGDLYATLGDLELANTPYPERAGPMNGHLWAVEFGTVHQARLLEINADLRRRFEEYIAARDEEMGRAKAKAAARYAEQRRRRYLALWVFGALAAIVVSALVWRRITRPA